MAHIALGLEVEGEATVEGDLVDRINGLEGVKAGAAQRPGLRHVLFVVDDIDESLAALQAQGGELVGELAEKIA